jgi:Zn-dependent protease with chaperone function
MRAALRSILPCLFGAAALAAAPAAAQRSSMTDVLRGFGQQLMPKQMDTSATTAHAKDRRCDRLFEVADVSGNAATLVPAVTATALGLGTRDVQAVLKDERLRNGVKNQLWIPAEAETRLAKSAHAEMVAKQQVVDEDDLNAMDRAALAKIRSVVAQLAAQLPAEQPYRFEVYLTTEDEANARALAGGIIYVSKAAARGSGELLTILLAHEVAHVTKRHQSRWVQGRLVDSATSVDQLLNLLRGTQEVITATMAQAGGLNARFARFSADQELEADACAVRLGAALPGLDVRAGVDAFLGMIEKEGSGRKARAAAAGELNISFDAAHPSYDERAQTMHGLIAYWRKDAAPPGTGAPPAAAAPSPDAALRGLLVGARKAVGR